MEQEDGEKEQKENIKEDPFCHSILNELKPTTTLLYSIAFAHSNSFLISSYHSLPETPPPNFS